MTEAAHEAGDETLTASARDGSVPAGQAALIGLRQPIVAILLLIAMFTTISGKPLDGFLMLTVAALLVCDAARSQLASAGRPETGRLLANGATAYPAASTLDGRRGLARLLTGFAWFAAAGLYAGVVGSFSRYSWPATIAVVAIGCLMIAVGWQGPIRQRQALTGQPLRRAWLWAAILVAGGLWELNSLLEQPHLTTDSYAHPTISALTDLLLASHPGRSVALGGWLLIGWFLVGR